MAAWMAKACAIKRRVGVIPRVRFLVDKMMLGIPISRVDPCRTSLKRISLTERKCVADGIAACCHHGPTHPSVVGKIRMNDACPTSCTLRQQLGYHSMLRKEKKINVAVGDRIRARSHSEESECMRGTTELRSIWGKVMRFVILVGWVCVVSKPSHSLEFRLLLLPLPCLADNCALDLLFQLLYTVPAIKVQWISQPHHLFFHRDHLFRPRVWHGED